MKRAIIFVILLLVFVGILAFVFMSQKKPTEVITDEPVVPDEQVVDEPPPPRKAGPLLPKTSYSIEGSTRTLTDDKLSPEVQVFGNYHTAGVILRLPADLASSGFARIVCYQNIGGDWRQVHDLIQKGATQTYMTSLFWLQPDSLYEVAVIVSGQSGETLRTFYGAGRTRKEPVVPDATTYGLYVSPDGDDANSGTQDAPLKTLAAACAKVYPDTTIFLRTGTYYEGDLSLARSGKAGQPIVIRSYPGEAAVLDGGNPALADPSVWKKTPEGLYTHAMEGKCFNVVLKHKKTRKEIRLLPLKTVEQLKTRTVTPAEKYGSFEKLGITGAYSWDGTSIWLMPPEPLENYKVSVAKRTRFMNLEGRNHVMLDGLTIRHYGKNDYSCGIFVQGSSDLLIQNCKFRFNDTYIWLKAQCDRVTIQDCSFKDDVINIPFGMVKTGGGLASYETGAVYTDMKYTGRGLVFRRNRIKNLFDGSYLGPYQKNRTENTSPISHETDFYHNVITDCVDDFLEVDGCARNVRVFENYMRRSLTGISIAQALDGPTFICYNVIADCGIVPSRKREGNASYPFKTNGGPEASKTGSGEVLFYHNTAYTTDPESRAIFIKRPLWKKLTFRNNIWYGKKYGMQCWKNPPSPMDWDFDCLYSADTGAPLVSMNYKTHYMTIEDVRANKGWLPNGLSVDPKVTNEDKGIYTLDPESQLVDAGTHVPGINDGRKIGATWDIGAYER